MSPAEESTPAPSSTPTPTPPATLPPALSAIEEAAAKMRQPGVSMAAEVAVAMLNAVGQITRLRAFELLMKNEPDGLAAGEVARRLGIPQNTMSTHLGFLARAGLVKAERQHRMIIYRAKRDQLSALTLFLNEKCFRDDPTSSRTEPGDAGQ